MNKQQARHYASAIVYGHKLYGGRFTPSPSVEENYINLLYAIYEFAVEDIKHPRVLGNPPRRDEREWIRADAYKFLMDDPYGIMNTEMKGGIELLYERHKRKLR